MSPYSVLHHQNRERIGYPNHAWSVQGMFKPASWIRTRNRREVGRWQTMARRHFSTQKCHLQCISASRKTGPGPSREFHQIHPQPISYYSRLRLSYCSLSELFVDSGSHSNSSFNSFHHIRSEKLLSIRLCFCAGTLCVQG